MSAPTEEVVSVRQLAQLAGRDPGDFHAHRLGASVHVVGPFSVALYPHDRWRDLFVAHLNAGFFDRSSGATDGPGPAKG